MDTASGVSGAGDEERPRPAQDKDLGFVRRPMVRWLDPHQLIDTAGRVLASGFSTSYTDSRQMQALSPAEVFDRSEPAEIWIDYASDLGDGWNSTYSVAFLLARDELELAHNGDVHRLERGAMVVLGGDQVYPVPTSTEYKNRFLGPYRSAMPCAPPGSEPEMFAIPGSHDWYDGLVNFTNIFCRQRPIGGWTSSQTRSYFAIRLPHHWWLWGVDLQFGNYLDEPQMSYFRQAAEELEPGDQVILCMAKEVESGRKSSEVCSTRDVVDLEREVVKPAGARIVLYLKSGRHYYARYQREDGATPSRHCRWWRRFPPSDARPGRRRRRAWRRSRPAVPPCGRLPVGLVVTAAPKADLAPPGLQPAARRGAGGAPGARRLHAQPPPQRPPSGCELR